MRRGTLAVRRGTEGSYFKLDPEPESPRIPRFEFVPSLSASKRRDSLLQFVHLTDVHTGDAESPGRFEFLERLYDRSLPLRSLLPSHRPQEALNLYAFELMMQTVSGLPPSLETGAPVQFLLFGGDNTDNHQVNELSRFMGVIAGREVRPFSGIAGYEGVQSAFWDDSAYWHPEDRSDNYKERWGFPAYPGLLDEAARPFRATGLRLPWLSCFGNHDVLAIGTIAMASPYGAILTGDQKPNALSNGEAGVEWLIERVRDMNEFLTGVGRLPETLLGGPARTVTADPDRRTYSPAEFIAVHRAVGGEPTGHGFMDQGEADARTYFFYDGCPGVRVVVLDTANPAGHYEGSIGSEQYTWLEQQLIEVHSRYFDPNGEVVTTGNEDRLTIISSHHGSASLTNALTPVWESSGSGDSPRVLGPQIQTLLLRFPNVILWLTGHTHRNSIRPRIATTNWSPSVVPSGYWEVTTCSLIDWPCQARRVEIVSNHDGTLSIFCTMVDHFAPADPHEAEGTTRLASIHRELAANDPHAGIQKGNQGEPSDQTVELLIPAPFNLD